MKCNLLEFAHFVKRHVFSYSNSEDLEATDDEKKRLIERYSEWFVST